MLDATTKRRIDTCRDILVGKVPDPKSQVEQITIALIYKFMDDMDAEAEELGGDRSFFAGDYAKYGWAKLMAPHMGGFDVLALYSEAIGKMNENPGIPALFRDIFKNAYLPYRDPETLRSFLKEIDGFSYDHSERLGDAFEYLLSVLGSQGDAGQFRTPRHIIDFMVDVINPQKNESVLDPACGTAGFLISAWKHILKQNSNPQPIPSPSLVREGSSPLTVNNSTPSTDKGRAGEGLGRPGDLLTPEERANLAANIHGYDISPDMVRLSLVNMYLHGFTDPHIIEYDTLTSEERWNETADVILANPPFMSPKGGIKPHKRFSVQATRSEVLFVDYIAEHLSPQGRAAIVVPEGIIFQSGTAYKQLREMLVKTSLVAVVSLPAGVFNPYSGVKTSILILDKRLAKACDSVLFVKVGNDGYSLGAQRRAVTGSDLPDAAQVLRDWMRGQFDEKSALATRVERARISENGEWSLSGERYREEEVSLSEFPFATLDELFTKIGNGVNVEQVEEVGKYRVTRIQTIADGSVNLDKTKFTNNEVKPESFLRHGDILLSHINSIDHLGKSAINLEQATDVIHGINLIRFVPDTSRIDPRYAIRIFKTDRFIDTVRSFAQKAVNQASVKTSDLRNIKIPIPPLPIQQEIVAEIEGYQKIIDGARQVVENYRPRINVQPDWQVVALGDICDVKSGGTPDRSDPSYWNGTIPWVKTGQIDFGRIDAAEEFITETGMANSSTRMIPVGTILMAMYGQGITRGKVAILGIDATINQACAAIIPKTNDAIDRDYLFHVLASKYQELRAISDARGGNQSNLNAQLIRDTKIPLPDLETQCAIVAEIEAEQALVNANKQLIERFEAKIKATINRVWGSGDE